MPEGDAPNGRKAGQTSELVLNTAALRTPKRGDSTKSFDLRGPAWRIFVPNHYTGMAGRPNSKFL